MILVLERHPSAPTWRFTCQRCSIAGAYHRTLNDAELSAVRHQRALHQEGGRVEA